MISAAAIPWRSVWRAAIITAVALAALYVLSRIPITVEVFVIAALIAFGINPVVRRFSRRMPRICAIALVYAALLALILVLAIVVIPNTITELENAFSSGGTFLDTVDRLFTSLQGWFGERFRQPVLSPQVRDIESHALTQLSGMFQTALTGIGNFVVGTASFIAVAIIGVVTSYYLLAHTGELRSFYYSLFPDRSQAAARAFADEVTRIFGGFMIGQAILSTFTGILTWGVLAVIGSNYALLLGVVAGLFYVIPYLGIVVAIVIGILLGLLQSWKMALLTGAIILVVSKFSDFVLAPKIMGESVGVSPLTIVFALFAGGELFGFWGLILAIPAAALFKIIWHVWLHPWLTGKPPEYAIEKSAAS